MNRALRHIGAVVMLVAWMLPGEVVCQVRISGLHLQRNMCAGERQTVSFGKRNVNTVVVGLQEATLGQSERIFLPDGVECDGSCSYKSPVTFTDFGDETRIGSADNIKYVRLKIEHSFIGDIYINITCPNGQKADIMRFAGSGSSACDGAIPQESRSWLQGQNMDESIFFGRANDNENTSDPCNENAPGNQPGVGWNYCWSTNTSRGYQYASGDGIVYRAEHAHHGHVDSSNVAAQTNFYHPDQHFSNLVGCPLNGTWYIEVVDGYSVDNGYIFEWELSLDESLLPQDCPPKTYAVQGPGVVRLGDSTFIIEAPEVRTDSAVSYRFIVITTCGDTVDTTGTVVFHPNVATAVSDTICRGDAYFVGPYLVDSSGTVMLSTAAGCDSAVHLTLTVYPSYDTTLEDSTCLNEPYAFEDSSYTTEGTFVHRFATAEGCDSIRRLRLHLLSKNLKAAIYAFPLVINENNREILLKDLSSNQVESRWMIGDMSYSQSEFTITYPIEQDSLEIRLEAASREGCYDTALAVARHDRSRIFVPNVFTPTMGQNDQWKPVVQDVVEMEVWIYSRQGVLVAHLETLGDSWDGGTWPQGTYTYLIRYRTRVHPDRWQETTGAVVMIR